MGNASEYEGPSTNTRTAECSVPHPMPGLPQCIRGPNRSTALYTCERTKNAVRRQDENSLLALHCLTTGHAFDWDRTSVIGKGSTKHTRDFIEAWNTPSTCVNQCVTLDPGYRASPNQLNNLNVSAESHTRQPPICVSNVYVCMTSALPPVFILIGVLPSYLYNPPSTH